MKELLRPDDTRDALRSLGALLFGVGILVLSVRKDGPTGFVNNDGWGDFPLFILYLIPAVVLYGGAVFTVDETRELRPWQSIGSVFGLLFIALALSQFVDLVGGNPSATLNVAWISLAVAALAFFAGIHAGVRFHFLAGGIALLITWLAVWDKILSDGAFGDLGTLRGLLGLFAILMLAAGYVLWRTQPKGLWMASELLTVAGISAVLATAVLSITREIAQQFASAFSEGQVAGGAGTTFIWDVVTLFVVLGLILIGTLIGTRGPVYIGAFGLILFAAIVGQDLDASVGDRENGFFGWPLVLLLLGILAIGMSFTRGVSLGDKPRRFIEGLGRSPGN
jgi:hypothetical protein